MTKRKQKRRIPTHPQWDAIRFILGNGWGDGDVLEHYSKSERPKVVRAVEAFEDWIEDRMGVRFACRIVPSRKGGRR